MIKQNSSKNIMIFMRDSVDHISGKTGLTLSISVSKNGAEFSSINPVVVDRGNGWYSISLTSAITNTVGEIVFHITASGADSTDVVYEVYSNDMSSVVSSVWSNPERTLTYPVVNRQVETNTDYIECIRGDTFERTISALGEISDYSSIYFTVKEFYKKDSDASSVLQVVKKTAGADGLLYLNGIATEESSWASITIDNPTTGSITVNVKPEATKELNIKSDYRYDIEIVRDDETVTTLAIGVFSVVGDVTRAIT